MVEAERITEHVELYRGSRYKVTLIERYQDRAYHPSLDSICATSLSDEKDIVGVPWFIFENRNLEFLTDLTVHEEKGFRNWLKKASPEEIDETAGEIKKCEEYIIYDAGYEFA
jgi:hypothetical protein